MNYLGRLHTVAPSQANVHQYEIGLATVSQSDCLIRGHGKPHHGVPGRLEISLGVQGDDRFVFDYENSHDMMGPILFTNADFPQWS